MQLPMKKTFTIALAGNPNSGKSSLFNTLTGLNQKVGNFPGVTVDKKTGKVDLPDTTIATIIDLPGSYSLYPRRTDERVSYEVLTGQTKEEKPDLIVIVVDACNLKRNLLYATQVIDLHIPSIVVLTMMDVAKKQGRKINQTILEKALGVPVISVNPRTGEGVVALKEKVCHIKEFGVQIKDYFSAPDDAYMEAYEKIKEVYPSISDYGALHILIQENKGLAIDPAETTLLEIRKSYPVPTTRLQGTEVIARYHKIDQILTSCVEQEKITGDEQKGEKADRILLHPVWGYVILLSVLFLLFQSVFWIAEYPMTAIEELFVWIEHQLSPLVPSGWYNDLLFNGILPGLSGIFVFVPQIMILFGLIGLLEETGYMARISFLTDKIMRKVGLNGKSIMPMISGFACAVPAIMSVRNIESKKERLLTILITPLMSCSARLPVYTILIALVIPNERLFGVLSLQGLVMMGLYLFGIFMALLVAWIAGQFIHIREKSFFILELPLYKTPRWKNVFFTMLEKAKIFVTDAGKVIMIISLILWALSTYGPSEKMKSIHEQYEHLIAEKPAQKEILLKEKEAVLLQESFAGQMGKYIEPVIQPLGYDWKIGIALIASFAAREVFVGTMATLYSVDSDNSDLQPLREKMKEAKRPDGTAIYSLATGVSLMLFYLLAMQCMSTIAVVKRETKSWKWPLIQFIYMSALAYTFSFLAYQLLS